MRVKNYSATDRSIRDRELRKQRATDRRFNDPLRLFIERKYSGIFKEYNELYKRMDDENPGRKNLATSGTFKECLADNPLKETATTTQASLSTLQTPPPMQLFMPQLTLERVDQLSMDILTQALRETMEPHQETRPQENADVDVHDEDELSTNSLAQAHRETVEPHQETRPQENADVENIINELLQEQAIQAILERADVNTVDDEGIGLLNVYDEVEMDIEPLDYYLEVEPFDF